MASVLKRGEKWYARYKDKSGKWVKIAGYKDKKETLRLAQRMEDEARKVVTGDVDPEVTARRTERNRPAMEHLAMFTLHMKSKGRHANHCQYTTKDVERCLEFTKVTTASALTLPMIDAWRSHCMTVGYPRSAKGLSREPDSPKTSNRRVASVKAWLRYLVSTGVLDRCMLDHYATLHTKGHETFHRRALSQVEVTNLIVKCPNEERKDLYRFAIFSGLRRSEIASLTKDSFDFVNKTIFLNAKDAKVKTAHAILPMHSILMRSLQTRCQRLKVGEPAFQVPHRTDIVKLLHEDCKVAGVDTREVDFHALRHTFCSLLAAEGIRPEVLMKLARHQDIATTMRFYVHFKADDERSALERIKPLVG